MKFSILNRRYDCPNRPFRSLPTPPLILSLHSTHFIFSCCLSKRQQLMLTRADPSPRATKPQRSWPSQPARPLRGPGQHSDLAIPYPIFRSDLTIWDGFGQVWSGLVRFGRSGQIVKLEIQSIRLNLVLCISSLVIWSGLRYQFGVAGPGVVWSEPGVAGSRALDWVRSAEFCSKFRFAKFEPAS